MRHLGFFGVFRLQGTCQNVFVGRIVQMAKANGVRWYGHVLRRDDGNVLRKALEFEVRGKRKRGQPRKTWKMQVEKESRGVGLKKEDALNRARWRVGVGKIAARVG